MGFGLRRQHFPEDDGQGHKQPTIQYCVPGRHHRLQSGPGISPAAPPAPVPAAPLVWPRHQQREMRVWGQGTGFPRPQGVHGGRGTSQEEGGCPAGTPPAADGAGFAGFPRRCEFLLPLPTGGFQSAAASH